MATVKTIILTTGGTGGHIFPALAVAEALKERGDVRLVFVGSIYGPESEMVRRAGLEFVGLPVRGVLGKGIYALQSLAYMGLALGKAVGIIRRYKPDAVLGFGGYASFAPVLAARLCGVLTAIHEQNAVMGVSNKVLGRVAHKVFLGLPLSTNVDADASALSHKCVLTGNPVRHVVAQVGAREHDFSGKRLLVVGGSQGATALNDVVMEYMPLLRSCGVQLRHQTGLRDEMRVRETYAAAQWSEAQASAFIHDMADAYDWADMVLCRAGASTVAELAAVGRAAVLVPFPFATHDHQTHNAASLVQQGAALMYAESRMREEDMMERGVELLQDAPRLQVMGEAAQAATQAAQGMTQVQAAQRISDEIFLLLQQQKVK